MRGASSRRGDRGLPVRARDVRFKVAGKIFAVSVLDGTPLEVSLKCEPDLAVALRDSYPAIRPGYHLDKRHWNTITSTAPADPLVRDLIEDSYDLVVSAQPKRVREQLGWAPSDRAGAPVARPPELPGRAARPIAVDGVAARGLALGWAARAPGCAARFGTAAPPSPRRPLLARADLRTLLDFGSAASGPGVESPQSVPLDARLRSGLIARVDEAARCSVVVRRAHAPRSMIGRRGDLGGGASAHHGHHQPAALMGGRPSQEEKHVQ